jgi:hypothetical protein
MRTRQLVLVFAGGLLVPSMTQSASLGRVAVTARLYNTARVPAAVADTALAVASRAMVASHIDITWHNCAVSSACGTVPGPRELVIRLVRSRDLPREPAALVLGEAFIDTNARDAVLATIYVDRVERMAELSETDGTLLLGRAIAHEVGHLLLGTTAHSSAGLMRAKWSSGDIRRNHIADWILTREDAAAIRRRLQ